MKSKLTTAITKDLNIRAYALDSTSIVERARQIHDLTPLASAALGRTLTAASMMGAALKGEKDSLTIRFRGDGPLGTVLAVSDALGNVRGYVQNPQADLPLNAKGKLDVGKGIGQGTLVISRDLGMKEPYIGQVPIVTGEVAEDITNYFAVSEQVPTVCALGVLVDVDWSIKHAGGVIIQLLPYTEDWVIDRLEENLKDLPSITQMMGQGMDNTAILGQFLRGFELDILQQREVEYRCYCSKERVTQALISLGAEELEKMREEQGEAELTCQFCDKVYHFSSLELGELIYELKNQKT